MFVDRANLNCYTLKKQFGEDAFVAQSYITDIKSCILTSKNIGKGLGLQLVVSFNFKNSIIIIIMKHAVYHTAAAVSPIILWVLPMIWGNVDLFKI